jgi:hypothetical protein
MKKRYEDGGEIDAMEEANKRTERTLSNPNAKEYGESGTSYATKATPKAMPKAAAKPAAKPAPKAESKPAPKAESKSSDESKMSVAERAKMSRERARSGSGSTDTRSVGERLRSAFAGKDRGGNSVDFAGSGLGMKRGGSVGSASRRADGIATKGKTKGAMVKMNYGGKC